MWLSDAHILVTGNITVTRTIVVSAGSPADTEPQRKQPLDAATKVVFNNCAPFKKCSTEIDGTLVNETDFINITMPIYNLIEYSDNYSDTSGSFWDFKRDEIDKMQMWLMIIMLLHLNIKQILLVILKQMEQKRSKNSCTTKIFK